MNHLHFLLSFLITLCLLTSSARAEGNARRNNVLKFGAAKQDYLIFHPDTAPLESSFTICAWIRDLQYRYRGVWFSYAVPNQGKEIQLTDNGYEFYLFGRRDYDLVNKYKEFNTTDGTWFHNCLSWSAATQTRKVYINGVIVSSSNITSGRILGQNGSVVIGNEQDRYGNKADMDTDNAFAGELYKLNVFSKMLTTTEIREMAMEMCSDVEESYGSARHIKWEDILQAKSEGNVTEKASGCHRSCKALEEKLRRTEDALYGTMSDLRTTERVLEKTAYKLNQTTERLDRALTKIEELEKARNTTSCPLNEIVTSHWDLLYSRTFYNEILTTERIGMVRSSLEKLELFVGQRISDKFIELFKLCFG